MDTWTRLSGLDAFFLHLESPRSPLHLGSVGIFEGRPLRDSVGAVRVDAVRTAVAQRLHAVPKLRQHVRVARLGDSAVWADDPGFDIARHVRSVALPAPGTESQLAELCAELLESPLDVDHPLWEMWLVDGLRGGEIAVVEKIHHAVADGLGGVELATVLLDAEPSRPSVEPDELPWLPQPEPGAVTVLGSDIVRRGRRALSLGIDALGALRHPTDGARRSNAAFGALRSLASARSIAPRSTFNERVGHGRRVAFARMPMGELRGVERLFGVTINDALLASVAGGLRRLHDERGEAGQVDGLNVLVPVGLDHDRDGRLGNRVAAMLVRLPVSEADPVARLRTVADEVSRSKRQHQAQATGTLVGLLDYSPRVVVHAAARLVDHQPFVNLVVTNVPGPAVPLYASGARMLEAFPFVPLAGNLTLGVAALSYLDQLSVGLVADRDRFPDLDVLARGIEQSFGEIAEHVDVASDQGGRS